jgi:cell fate (sporulation/competence/biofilm development) regulator YlbF (YheA/YmcA/DUF963 family)
MTLEEKARDLGRLIAQSSEYQALRRANDALAGDRQALETHRRMEQLRVDIGRMLERGERPTEEMETQLEALLTRVQTDPTYQRLIVAQENFDKVMSHVYEWIWQGIEKGAASPIITLS